MSNWKKGKKLNNGQYIIESILLRSSAGLAYKAIDNETKNFVTIKTINNITQIKENNPKKYQQLIKQAIKISSYQHPNLIKLNSEILQEDEQLYMVMEHIEGEDLASYLDRNGKFTDTNAARLITKIGSGLNLLHENGFIHQDIKPQNIILKTDSLEPVLIDFGSAIEIFTYGNKKVNKNLMDYFTAIEIYSNPNQIGPCTDIYSLAATLYVLVTGQLPTPCNSRQYQQLISPKQHNRNLTDGLSQAILKGLEVNAASRPQTLKQWFKLLLASENYQSIPTIIEINTPESNNRTQVITQDPNYNNQNAIEELLPTIETFEFESVTLEPEKKLFGFISRINKNITPKTGKYFSEKINPEISIDMIFIPEGSFIIGSNNNEPEREKDESPTQKIKISSFYMSKFPITQAQWRAVASLQQIERSLNPNPSFFKGDNLPVEKVSWYDAVEFCQRLTQYTKRKYRLPTEAEWEYSCRAGTTTPFYFGDIISTDCANYDGRETQKTKETGKYERKTTPVDTFSPNPLGLYDLHGNVWEWCEDHYSPTYKSKPTDGTAYYSGKSNQPRLVRGGSWSLKAAYCRSAKRSSYAPDSNYNFVGFRIVCILN